MLVSIITPTWNSSGTLPTTIASVRAQTYEPIEHIIIDGGSTDQTLPLLRSQSSSRWISEPDGGLYEAINKGLSMAQGDIVGVLNADDFLALPGTVEQLVGAMRGVDAVYGDVVYVNPHDLSRPVRYYSSASFRPGMFLNGYMPAHPTFYARRDLLRRFGMYRIDYAICADYELLLRYMLIHGIHTRYVAGHHVTMRTGGVSNANPMSRLNLNREMVRACRDNGLSVRLPKMAWKYPHKIQDFVRPQIRAGLLDTEWFAAFL